MTVPFQTLGESQVARLAYQIIGKGGPIANPRNIRYLAPDSSEAQGLSMLPASANPAGALLGMSWVNLGLSAANLAISARILANLNRIENKVDRLLDWTSSVDSNLKRIIKKVDAIDIKVSENNLRHAIQYIVKESITNEGINLNLLAEVKDELDKFLEACDFEYGGSIGLKLSADVRGILKNIYRIFLSTRTIVLQHHNIKQHGNPVTTLRIDPLVDYTPSNSGLNPQMMLMMDELFTNVYKTISNEVAVDIYKFFTFADDEDRIKIEGLIDESIIKPIIANISRVDSMAANAFWNLCESDGYNDLSQSDKIKLFFQYRNWWLSSTDAGLLHRTRGEAKAITDEYGYGGFSLESKKLEAIAEQATEETISISVDLAA